MGSVLENFLSEVAEESEAKPVNDQKKTAPHQKKSASSSLMDIRDMAQRYHRMRDLDRMRDLETDFVDATDDWPLADGELSLAEQIVVPETEDDKAARAERNKLLIPLFCVSGLALIATTAAVTLLVTGGMGGGSDAVAVAQGGVVPAVVDSSNDETVEEVTPVLAAEPVVPDQELAPVTEEEFAVVETQEEDRDEEIARDTSDDDSADVRSSSSEVASSSAAALTRAAADASSSEPAAAKAEPAALETSTEPAPSWAGAEAEKAAPAAAPTCDEVLCLLEGRACCGKSAAKAPGADAAKDERADLPKNLERSDIEQGLKSVSGRLSSCGSKYGVTGSATIKFRILGSGKVQSADTSTGDEAFQQCVASVAKKATFAKTQEGVTINYPVIMR